MEPSQDAETGTTTEKKGKTTSTPRAKDKPLSIVKTISKEKKRKHIVLPENDDTGVIYKTDGTTEMVKGQFDLEKLRTMIICNYVQMVPCTMGNLKDKFELWMNEEGLFENEYNERASDVLGKQVFGGELYGNVLLVKCGVID